MADLSGGERRRLGLIKLMLSKANFLILDDRPTILIRFDRNYGRSVADYSGTMLIVSHDRSFLHSVVDRCLAIVNGSLQSFPTYQEYLEFATDERQQLPRVYQT